MNQLLKAFLFTCGMCLLTLTGSAQFETQMPGENEQVKLRLMMVDALLDINRAMLEGVNASIDTLNLPENTNVIKDKDMQVNLLRMKRARDKALLMPYLEHLQDSLGNEVSLLQKEKLSLENMLATAKKVNPVVVKTQTLVSKKDTLVLQTTLDPVSGIEETRIANTRTDEVIVMNDAMTKAEKKQSEKKLKKYKNLMPLDTVLVFDAGGPLRPEPERGPITPVGMPDTGTIARIRNDTTAAIKIVIPNTKDSIVIKPVKAKPHGKPDEAPVVVEEKPKPGRERNDKSASTTATDSLAPVKAEFFLNRALRSINEGNNKNAADYLNKAVELYPNYYEAWYTLAEMDANNGADSKALKEYKRCTEIDSSKALVFYKMGALYMKTNRKKEAFDCFNKAIAINQQYIDALMMRAAILVEQGELIKAIGDYDMVTKTDRTFYKAYKARGFAKMEYKIYSDAADDFTRFLIFEPDNAESYYYRGICRLGNHELMDGCLDLSTALDKGYTAAEKVIKKSCE